MFSMAQIEDSPSSTSDYTATPPDSIFHFIHHHGLSSEWRQNNTYQTRVRVININRRGTSTARGGSGGPFARHGRQSGPPKTRAPKTLKMRQNTPDAQLVQLVARNTVSRTPSPAFGKHRGGHAESLILPATSGQTDRYSGGAASLLHGLLTPALSKASTTPLSSSTSTENE